MISVIIPVYNVKPYLGQCLMSVKTQTSRDWECIVVDDASTDGSGEELDRIAGSDKRFTIIHHEKNMGLAATRNDAVAAAKGESIVYIDSDDWIEPYTLDYLDAEAHNHPEAGRIVGLDMMYWPKYGWNLPWEIKPAGMHAPDSPYLFSGPDCDPGHVTGCLYIRKNIPGDLVFPKVKLFEDMIYNMGTMFAGCSTYITKMYLYHYIRRDDSLLSINITEEDAEVTRKALSDLAERYNPKPEVYERCRRFLENALNGKLGKK